MSTVPNVEPTPRARRGERRTTLSSASRAASPAIDFPAGCYVYRLDRFVPLAPGAAFRPVRRLGGEDGFYFASLLWRMRGWTDRLFGGMGMGNPRMAKGEPIVGDAINMWSVEAYEPDRSLVLCGKMKLPGRGWLRFDVAGEGSGSRLFMTAYFVPKGWLGGLYWWSFYFPHEFLFRGMMRNMVRVAIRADRVAQASAKAAPTTPNESIPDSAVFIRPRQSEKVPPCQVGCPSGADVRSWVNTIAQRGALGLTDAEAYAKAWRTIVEVNPFPAITGRICPHPCEAGCNRLDKDGSLSVHQMERFLGDWAIDRRLSLPRIEDDTKPESIGVVGSGPAGMSFAYQMARRGYRVTIYEGNEQAGGMLRYGIPEYRLPGKVLDAEVGRILALGVELRLNTRIGRDIDREQLAERHAAVFLGIGAQQGRDLGIPGEAGAGCWTGVEFLGMAHRGNAPALGGRVVVVGGGDTAIDAARVARRTGAEVRIIYRRGEAEMPAEESEIEAARLEGVVIDCLVAPVEVRRDGDRVQAVLARRMRLGEEDSGGRRRPLPIEGSEFEIPATSFIPAVSQKPDWHGLEVFEGEHGWSKPGPFGRIDDEWWVGGDVEGAGIASLATARGRLAAESLHARLRGLPQPQPGLGTPIGEGAVKPESYGGPPRSAERTRAPEEWLTRPDDEIAIGLTESEFQQEAGRCLSCGNCFGCEQCWMYCAHGCFTRLEDARPGAYFSLSLDHCKACGKCVDVCPCGFLEVRDPA